MNIFVTDPDPVKSAQVLPDKHIVKMPLETCQMLAIVASPEWGYNFGTLPKLDGTPYKTSKGAFRGHPQRHRRPGLLHPRRRLERQHRHRDDRGGRAAAARPGLRGEPGLRDG